MKLYGGFANFEYGTYNVYEYECTERDGEYCLNTSVPVSSIHSVNALRKSQLELPLPISNTYGALDINFVYYSLDLDIVIDYLNKDKEMRTNIIQERLNNIEKMHVKYLGKYEE